LPPLPVALFGAGVAAFDGKIWVAGGQQGSYVHPLSSVYIYSPRSARWADGPALPAALDSPALVSDGRSLYVIGGWTGTTQSASVWRLGVGSDHWQPMRPLPKPRSAGAAAWDGKRIVFGGGDDNAPEDDVYAFANDRWKVLGHLSRPREHLAAAADPRTGTVWFVGGRGNDPSGRLPDVDTVTSSGIHATRGIQGVQGAAAVGVGSGFCVIGGFNGDLSGQVQCRGIRGRIPPLTRARSQLGAAVLNGAIYVVGGHEAQPLITATVEKLTLPAAG
jgi:N-acetylneuraminic acid mutarotase